MIITLKPFNVYVYGLVSYAIKQNVYVKIQKPMQTIIYLVDLSLCMNLLTATLILITLKLSVPIYKC